MRVSTITIALFALLTLALAATAHPGLVAVARSNSVIWNAVAVPRTLFATFTAFPALTALPALLVG